MKPIDYKRAAGEPMSKEELIEGSPTLKAILGGEAKIRYVSDFLQTRNIKGKEWHGRNYGYEIRIPVQSVSDKERILDISTWSPLPLN